MCPQNDGMAQFVYWYQWFYIQMARVGKVCFQDKDVYFNNPISPNITITLFKDH